MRHFRFASGFFRLSGCLIMKLISQSFRALILLLLWEKLFFIVFALHNCTHWTSSIVSQNPKSQSQIMTAVRQFSSLEVNLEKLLEFC
jgi:hypothetical protein